MNMKSKEARMTGGEGLAPDGASKSAWPVREEDAPRTFLRNAPLAERVAEIVERLEFHDRLHAVGSSRKWLDVLAQATRVAPTLTTVLLTGESGTGKEIVARLIHRGSSRPGGPFVALNCAALPETLLESELFGHERGAFTGAVSARPGRIEQAAGGTLFLDEVGEMSPAVQAKLLRVLEAREFHRLGGTRSQKADVRVIAATNRDLGEATANGLFREDLFYRLAVFEISIAPLRERREDILNLSEHFVRKLGMGISGVAPRRVTPAAAAKLHGYAWPGNVRQLRNTIERALILCDGEWIGVEHLPESLDRAHLPRNSSGAALKQAPATASDLEDIERSTIHHILQQTDRNKAKAARLLGLTRKRLCTRIQRLGLEVAQASFT